MSDFQETVERLTRFALDEFALRRHEYDYFLKAVENFFLLTPGLVPPPNATVHSLQRRLKSDSSLRDKISRKLTEGIEINESNLFDVITDWCGLRVLHLHTAQLIQIDHALRKHIESENWVLLEPPVAYSWDPERSDFFASIGLSPQIKPSHYTSIHYVIKPRNDVKTTCEIQVRTLFEEVWGEIDHAINYPHPTSSLACREQLLVLAKLVSTGTRLGDSIFKCYAEELSQISSAISRQP